MRDYCGALLGDGGSRECYAHAENPALVIKFEKRPGFNQREWDAWKAIEATGYAQYFAPCFEIGDGWMTQARCDQPKRSMPPMIPAICSRDTTRRNFGWLNGRFVCLDMSHIKPGDVTPDIRFRRVHWKS